MNSLLNFRTNLRSAMVEKAISQRGLAEGLGMSFSHVNRILQGATSPSLDICERLAEAVGFSVADLLHTPKKFSAELLHRVA